VEQKQAGVREKKMDQRTNTYTTCIMGPPKSMVQSCSMYCANTVCFHYNTQSNNAFTGMASTYRSVLQGVLPVYNQGPSNLPNMDSSGSKMKFGISNPKIVGVNSGQFIEKRDSIQRIRCRHGVDLKHSVSTRAFSGNEPGRKSR